jgi:uncharacterized protein YjbI with pentapeptide repeats
VEPQKTPRERAENLINLLVPDWRPTRGQVLRSVRVAVVVAAALLVVLLVLFLIGLLFGVTLMNLLRVLAVPITVGAAVPLLNWLQKKRELEITEQRAKTDRQIAEEQRQDEALRAYIDEIGRLLLDKDNPLRKAQLQREGIRTLARARTLMVLRRVDSQRRRSVVEFLSEAQLIHRGSELAKSLGVKSTIISLDNADLGGTDLSRLNLSKVRLFEADLSDTNLSYSVMDGATLEKALLRKATLHETILDSAKLREADLRTADLRNVKLTQADLNKARLCGANLSEAELDPADLNEADLSNANLSDAFLEMASLRKANLHGANLREAWVEGADLRDADLRSADLIGTDFKRANLTNANLSGADLTIATITQEQLQQAASLEGATMPDGQKYEDLLKDREMDLPRFGRHVFVTQRPLLPV